jgi:signal transduction histidine kinase
LKEPAATPSLRPLAHELRNAIAPVRNAAHLLRKRASGDPIVAAAVKTIDAALTQSLRLLDRAVDAERVMRGDVHLASDDVDVAAVVRQALEHAQQALDERRQRVRVDVRDTGVRVRGDAARLAQVVSTLIDNASRYSGEGADIDVAVDAADGFARVRVADRGAGIAAAFLPRVFEPFTQRDVTTTRRHGGLGLGLAIVKHIVEAHGGRIDVQSQPGAGTQFTVRLPLRNVENATA